MKATDFPEILPALLKRLTTDLAASLGCQWALAMTSLGDDLLPLFCFGENGDLERSIAHVQLSMAGAVGTTRYWYQPRHPYASPSLPVAILHMELSGGTYAIALGAKNNGAEFAGEDHALMSEFAAHVAKARVEDLWRTSRRGRIVSGKLVSGKPVSGNVAGKQVSEMPPAPEWVPQTLSLAEGLDYYGECQPAGAEGGDFFDLLPASPASLTVSIGDACGKGVPAAIITAGLQASLRALTPARQKLSTLVSSLNQMVWELSPTGFFTTVFFGIFDLIRQELHYVNAGHPAPLLIRAKRGRVMRLDPNGAVLGLSANGNFRERTVAFQPGDWFVGLTDGVMDSETDPGAFENRVIEIVRENREQCSSLELARKILSAAGEPRSAPDTPGDRTVVVVRLKDRDETGLETERAEANESLCAVAHAA